VQSGSARPIADLDSESPVCLAAAPGEDLLAVGGALGGVRLMGVDGRLIHRLHGHDGLVNRLAFSSDGRLLASAGADGLVLVFGADGGGRFEIEAHDGEVGAVSFTPDGRFLVTGGRDGRIRLWGASDGRKAGDLKGHDDWIRALVVHPDGERLYTAGGAGVVKVWRLAELLTPAATGGGRRAGAAERRDLAAKSIDLKTHPPAELASVLPARGLVDGRELAVHYFRVQPSRALTRAWAAQMEPLTRIDHPHILRAVDYGWGEDYFFLAAEAWDEDLAAFMHRRGLLTPRRAAGFLYQILTALADWPAAAAEAFDRGQRPPTALGRLTPALTLLFQTDEGPRVKIDPSMTSSLIWQWSFKSRRHPMQHPDFILPGPPAPEDDAWAAAALFVYMLNGRPPAKGENRGGLLKSLETASPVAAEVMGEALDRTDRDFRPTPKRLLAALSGLEGEDAQG
jgi:WD40 repeat protein